MTQMVPVLKAALVVIRIYSYRHISGMETGEEWKAYGVAFLVERHEGRVVDLDDRVARVLVHERERRPVLPAHIEHIAYCSRHVNFSSGMQSISR